MSYGWFLYSRVVNFSQYGWHLFCQWCGYFAQREELIMEGIENVISMLDYILNTSRKRHIAGGCLMSAACLFAGLALTIMTIKDKENTDE